MDVNTIEQKLASLQQKPKQKYEKVDYTKIFWKPKVGKAIIRIVPAKESPKDPFKEVMVHYGIAKFPMLALTNYGEKDPIVEFCNQLKKSGDKEDWKLSKKLSPKMRVYVPVIVRGEEELGTRLWEFGKEIYTELLNIAKDEDIGDYTSISNGRDITVDTVGPEVTGTTYNKSSVRAKVKVSPITEDKALLERILNEQPDILKVYKKQTFEDMKTILQNFLEPKEEEPATIDETDDDTPVVAEAPIKKSKANSFEDLFNK